MIGPTTPDATAPPAEGGKPWNQPPWEHGIREEGEGGRSEKATNQRAIRSSSPQARATRRATGRPSTAGRAADGASAPCRDRRSRLLGLVDGCVEVVHGATVFLSLLVYRLNSPARCRGEDRD
jgi:hypothetical protein